MYFHVMFFLSELASLYLYLLMLHVWIVYLHERCNMTTFKVEKLDWKCLENIPVAFGASGSDTLKKTRLVGKYHSVQIDDVLG